MPVKRSHRRFCHALNEECAGKLRWSTIAKVANRLGIDEDEAIVLAADCAAAGLVRLDVKGPPYAQLPSSAALTEDGRRLLKVRSR